MISIVLAVICVLLDIVLEHVDPFIEFMLNAVSFFFYCLDVRLQLFNCSAELSSCVFEFFGELLPAVPFCVDFSGQFVDCDVDPIYFLLQFPLLVVSAHDIPVLFVEIFFE